MTELLHGRALDSLEGFAEPGFDMSEVNAVANLEIYLYGADTVRQAKALLDRSERFFGLDDLGADMQGSAMHQTLLTAYDKLFACAERAFAGRAKAPMLHNNT
jgi:hypothetical protein